MPRASTDSSKKSWALGCGSVLIVVMLALIVFGGMVALERRREADPTSIDHSFPLPPTGEGATLVLDLEGVELTIVPGAAGAPIRVEGAFDAAGFTMITERSESEDGRPSYTLRLRPRSFLSFVAERDDGQERMIVTLPREAAIDIGGNLAAGVSDIELGGLDIVAINLRLGKGDHRLAFSEPLAEPMRSLLLDAPFGKLTLVELGNARPGEIRIGKTLGEACIDLRGAWQSDVGIEMDCGAGSCDLHRPLEDEATVLLAGEEAAPADSGLPRITVEVLGAFDRVEISPSLTEQDCRGRSPRA